MITYKNQPRTAMYKDIMLGSWPKAALKQKESTMVCFSPLYGNNDLIVTRSVKLESLQNLCYVNEEYPDDVCKLKKNIII